MGGAEDPSITGSGCAGVGITTDLFGSQKRIGRKMSRDRRSSRSAERDVRSFLPPKICTSNILLPFPKGTEKKYCESEKDCKGAEAI